MFARTSIVLLVGIALRGVSTVTAEPQRDLGGVLRRAGAYVEEFQRQLSGIVAEETYLQKVVPFPGGLNEAAAQRRLGVRPERRRLRSDLLLLRPEGAVTWVQFRDVFDVDGQPVRDREERLTRLFLDGGLSGTERVQQIRSQSARYNIGRIERTMNVPVLPLAVLALPAQPRFRFSVEKAGDQDRAARQGNSLPGTPNFKVSAEVWIVKFEEREGPTLVRSHNGDDIFSRGRFWIEPDTGRVLMSEMVTADQRVRGELLVSYQSEPLLGFLVPVELREEYSETGYPATITGEATYGNFRRFQVAVDEAIGPIR